MTPGNQNESCEQNWQKFIIALAFWLSKPEVNDMPRLINAGLCEACSSAMHQNLLRVGMDYVFELLPKLAVDIPVPNEFKH